MSNNGELKSLEGLVCSDEEYLKNIQKIEAQGKKAGTDDSNIRVRVRERERQTSPQANKFKAKSPEKMPQAKSQAKENKSTKFKSGYQAPKTASKGQSQSKGRML